MSAPPGQSVAVRREMQDEVAVLVLDLPGESVNKLSRAVKDELAERVEALIRDPAVRAVVLISGKADTFVAGADIEEFVALRSAEEAFALSREAHAFLDRVARSPKPIVAAIHGACLGGGLEIALACGYRVATDHPKTVLAAPEVQLGIIPGAGGCNRLPRLVGLPRALDLILSGRNVRGTQAYRMGLVDELVPPPILRDVALAAARRLAAGGAPARRGRRGLGPLLLERNPLGRALVLRRARGMTLKRTRGHYPAPLAAIEAVGYGLAHGVERGMVREAQLFGKLATSEVSRRLVEIFFATTRLKKDPGVDPPAPEPKPVGHLGVIGAGYMGSGIGVVAASRAGVTVRMRDADLPKVGRGLDAAAKVIHEAQRRRQVSWREAERQLALLSGTTDYSGFARAGLVIEAVFEDLEVKRGVLREAEAVIGPDCVFASNTSTIPIARIAEAASRPERVLGMHFFSPVHRMPLLEVIAGEKTAAWATVTAVAFGRRMGKTAIVVRDRPGFFVNRILSPYMNEAGHLMAEGVPIEAIDRAMVGYGFPVGPISLLDEIGLDVAEKAGRVMHEGYGARFAPAAGLDKLVAAGRLGRKSGAGFFRYRDGKRAGVDPEALAILGLTPRPAPPAAELADRLVCAMLNEAVRALEENVVRSPRDGDIAALFGIGYPPFRGGPYRTLDVLGAGAAVESLERLSARYGDRYSPAALLLDHARTGATFHGRGR